MAATGGNHVVASQDFAGGPVVGRRAQSRLPDSDSFLSPSSPHLPARRLFLRESSSPLLTGRASFPRAAIRSDWDAAVRRVEALGPMGFLPHNSYGEIRETTGATELGRPAVGCTRVRPTALFFLPHSRWAGRGGGAGLSGEGHREAHGPPSFPPLSSKRGKVSRSRWGACPVARQ